MATTKQRFLMVGLKVIDEEATSVLATSIVTRHISEKHINLKVDKDMIFDTAALVSAEAERLLLEAERLSPTPTGEDDE